MVKPKTRSQPPLLSSSGNSVGLDFKMCPEPDCAHHLHCYHSGPSLHDCHSLLIGPPVAMAAKGSLEPCKLHYVTPLLRTLP